MSGRVVPMVSFDNSKFRAFHGKNPSGLGRWVFELNIARRSEFIEFVGTLSQAKEQCEVYVKREFVGLNYVRVFVCH